MVLWRLWLLRIAARCAKWAELNLTCVVVTGGSISCYGPVME
jgi:hypothetical protein